MFDGKSASKFLGSLIFLSVHDTSIAEGIHDFIDSASMMMHYGYPLYPVWGEPENIKITTPSDYYMFTGILKTVN